MKGHKLHPREEYEIARLRGEGKRPFEIADEIGRPYSTIRNYFARRRWRVGHFRVRKEALPAQPPLYLKPNVPWPKHDRFKPWGDIQFEDMPQAVIDAELNIIGRRQPVRPQTFIPRVA